MNKRQIPFLHWKRRADGSEVAHWIPSPRLRKMGWSSRLLGTRKDEGTVILEAMKLNRQVEEFDQPFPAATKDRKVFTFSDLVGAYRASQEYQSEDLADSTRREYDSRIRQLEFWADDGHMPVRSITKKMVTDLKTALLAKDADGNPGSKFKCAAMLRILRLLMRWGVDNGHVPADPTAGVKIPTPPSRTQKLDWDSVQAMAAQQDQLGNDQNALLFTVAFWTIQRRADLIQMNRMAWRTFEGMAAADRAVLANSDGDVKGFRIQQAKTKKWVDCPIPPFLHDRIEAALKSHQYLFPHATEANKPKHEKSIERMARKTLDAAGFEDKQLRDMRRSGMIWLTDMGADRSDVFAISGHDVLGRRTIVDTYMPPDTRTACRAMAAAVRTLNARIEKEKAK